MGLLQLRARSVLNRVGSRREFQLKTPRSIMVLRASCRCLQCAQSQVIISRVVSRRCHSIGQRIRYRTLTPCGIQQVRQTSVEGLQCIAMYIHHCNALFFDGRECSTWYCVSYILLCTWDPEALVGLLCQTVSRPTSGIN